LSRRYRYARLANSSGSSDRDHVRIAASKQHNDLGKLLISPN
jgi:hypothetical protein